MCRISTGLLFLLVIAQQLGAQILPREGSKLNYRIIGFSFPLQQRGCKYRLEIASGNYNSEDSFKKNITRSYPADKNRIIREVPSFGKQYTWRIVYTNIHSSPATSSFHHFSIGINSCVDTSATRLRILKHAEKYKDAYVFMDGSRALYDMNGMPVWYLPNVYDSADKIWGFGDLRSTKQGTITYLTTPKGGHVYEANFNGTVLWSGPNNGKVSGDSIEYFNHEFMKLTNGHYMALGGEYVQWKLPGAVDTGILNSRFGKGKIKKDSTNTFYQKLHFGTLIEYDRDSNVVWAWKSSKYFRGSDVYDHTTPKGIFDIDDVHPNSFYFDEKNKVIYIGFRDISRIIKIQYPEGNILAVYGKKYNEGVPGYDNHMFFHQHSCKLSQDGYLYMYNNNNRYPGSLPSLVVMQEPANEKDTLRKIWEYQCSTEGIDTSIKEIQEFAALGSVVELPDRSLLASMTASKYTRIFIVNRDKKVLWNAMLERCPDPHKHKWYSVIQYRASIITDRKDLELLIWNAEEATTAN